MVYFMDYRPPNISYQFVTQNQPEGRFILWTIDRPIFLVKELLKNEEKGKLYDQVNLEPLIPLSFICLTKVRMFWETIKLFCKFF